MTKAAALQEAKQWLRTFSDEKGRRIFQHPAYWSGFVLIVACHPSPRRSDTNLTRRAKLCKGGGRIEPPPWAGYQMAHISFRATRLVKPVRLGSGSPTMTYASMPLRTTCR